MGSGRYHAKERSRRIHADGLSWREIRRFEGWIRKGRSKARFVARYKSGRFLYKVRHRGRWWAVVVQAQADGGVRVITVLPAVTLMPPTWGRSARA